MTVNISEIRGIDHVKPYLKVSIKGVVHKVPKELFFQCMLKALARFNLTLREIRDGMWLDIHDQCESDVPMTDPRYKASQKLCRELVRDELAKMEQGFTEDLHYAPFWWPYESDMA